MRDLWLEIGFGSGEHLAGAGGSQSRDRHDRLRTVPQRRGGLLEHIDTRRLSAISASWPKTPARCSTRCPTPRSAGPSCCFPTPGRSRATTSGASSARKIWRGSPASWRTGRNCGWRATIMGCRHVDAGAYLAPSGLRWLARTAGGLAQPSGRLAAVALRGRKACEAGRNPVFLRFRRKPACPRSGWQSRPLLPPAG